MSARKLFAGRARSIVVFAAVLLLASAAAGLTIALGAEDTTSGQATAESAPPVDDPGVELPDKRTATSQTFRLPGGALETWIFEAPINYRDREGDWKPIEEGLEEAEAGGLINGPNSFDVNLPERLGAAHPVRLSIGDQWISFQLVGQPLEPAQLEEGVASYESPDGATSFDFSSLANGLKEDIEIGGPSAPSSFEFELSTSAGLTPSLTEDGLLQFRGAEGQLLASMPAPVISDSAPGAQPENAVHYKLNPEGENEWRLVLEADPEWLEQPGRVWPANIDPTTYIAESPSLDCYMVSNLHASHGCGSGGWQSLNAKAKYVLSGETETGRSILRFNLESIPTNAYVTEATINLNAPSAVKNTSGVQLRQVSAAWSSAVTWINRESGIQWATRGGDYTSAGSEILTSERGSQAGLWAFSQGLTPLVRGWVSRSISNQGVIVKLRDEANRECSETSCIERLAEFQSSAAADSTKRPHMTVAYYPVAPSTSKVVSPGEGTRTARRLKLKAAWSAAGTTGVTFQYKLGGHSAEFTNIPSSLVRNAKGEPVSWPMAVQGNQSEPLYFDAVHADPSLLPHGGQMKIRALFEGSLGAAGYSTPVTTTINRFLGGTRDATTTVGPGTVNLLTGNYTISRTDVSIPGFGSALEFSRTDNSRVVPAHPEEGGVLGAGWQPSIAVEAAGGAAWRKVSEVVPSAEEAEEGIGAYALLVDLEGYEYAFEASGSEFISPPEFTGWILSRQDATHLALTDPDGNQTIFEKEASGSDYLPKSVSQTGSGNQTRMVYELVEGKKRLSEIVAPAAAGVNCTENPKTTQGCRVLTFSYQPASAWGAPSSYGYRLSMITYYGPSGPSSMSSWEVARYSYNAEGRLVEEWDPRIHPYLVESYTYKTGGQLATLSPPGEEPWTFDYYGSYDGEEANGRLLSVKRPSLLASPSVAQTTIVYGVPLSGGEAPYDMSAAAVAQWGQQDIPADATAVFPPDQVPGSPPSSYSRAAVYYMDAEGQMVNTATPSGAGTSAPSITTAETDEYGNVVRELSAQNRLRALAAGASSVARSHELETKRNYSADGTEMQEEWGPMHEVRLESGSLVQARLHRTVEYDVGEPTPPAGTPMAQLPTRETTGASIPGQGTDADQRVTETRYDWTLRKPIETIVEPLGLNLHTRIAYDPSSGLATERSLPAEPKGGDAHTTKTIYYTAGTNPLDGSCGNSPGYANLPCKVMPAAQPGSGGQPELLVTTDRAYSPMGQPTEVLESPGGSGQNVRTTITSYDTAGRETSRKQEGGGTAIPPTQTIYSSTTGRLLEQRFTCESSCEGFDNQAVITTYDKLGRVTAYQDADGNTSAVTYDLLSRPVTTNDGKGTQTFGYDPTSGLLVSLQDSAAGTFTASYNADGSIVEEGLPDGLLATTTYDESGAPTHLSYEKKTFCSLSCTWLEFGAERSIYGQVLAQTSTASSQQYSYDKAGRLTLTKDTPQGGGCTTRSYSFDADSNRTALVTRAPGIGGACDTSSEGTIQKYSYDAADRLLDTHIVYDSYGRVVSLPGSYAGGTTLSTSYYTNDLVASQTQGSITNSYQLDGALRQRLRTETGGSEPGTEVYHYAGGSDSPAWIERGSSWSRNIGGIGKELAAVQDSAKGTTLELTNLHGDIVATASPNPEATKLLATLEFDEFGNPKQGSAGKYGWLGGKQRRTELPSGTIQMGVRSYVPAIGRFLSLDPKPGESANGYDYVNQDPTNKFDLSGCAPSVVGCLRACIRAYCHGVNFHIKYTRVENCIANSKGVLSAILCLHHACDLWKLTSCGLHCISGPPPPPGVSFRERVERILKELERVPVLPILG
jgi:RHS repeat-associated protein